MIKSFFSCFLLKLNRLLVLQVFWYPLLSKAQDTDFPLGTFNYAYLERQKVVSGQQFFTSFKPYSRKKGHELAFSGGEEGLDSRIAFNRSYVLLESREYGNDSLTSKSKKPFLGHFYKHHTDLVSVRSSAFDLHVNPVGELGLGYDRDLGSPLFVNTRGITLRGTVDRKVSFSTFIHENQMRLPGYVQAVQDTVGVIPREGFWKGFGESGYDFLRAQGYIDFAFTPHISAQMGFGRHFVGNGTRSMILSDFGNSYPYLRITTEVWRIKYTNLFAELIADVFFFDEGTLGSEVYPKKYFSFHHLDIAVTNDFHIGLFESVLNGRPDSLGGSNFEVQYLNPIIFYGALEQQDGSAGNVIVGMDFSWDLWNKVRFYGQFVLDELILSELLNDTGWWGNKYGYQLGLKFFDFLAPTFNWQLEHNRARPFTYSHDGAFTSYTHYRQPLAHPLGANFSEWLLSASYQPIPRLTLQGTLVLADYGSGPVNGFSIGRDPLINSNNRGLADENDYDNRQGQGIPSDLLHLGAQASYQLKHNLFVDVQANFRKEDRQDRSNPSTTILVGGVRWNIARRSYWF